MKSIILFVLLFSYSNLFAKELSSENQRTILMELFSSEGCSSCPPAEKQRSELVGSKDLWKKIVPINFHVDYWNQLGWVDPYSNKQFTDRQHQYAELWKVRSIYTPAFVNNGESVGAGIQIEKSGIKGLEKIPKIKLNIDKNKSIAITASDLPAGRSFQVHVALLGNKIISNVTAGENKGRKLSQNFVALDYKILNLKMNKAETTLNAQGSNAKPGSYSVVAWITEAGKMIPLQAVGGDL